MDLWIVKHRPRSLDQFVWRDQEMRRTVEGWLKERSLPHCLFSGQQGAGKTSMALLLLDLLAIPNEDLLKINASRERKIDDLQDKIINFLGSWTFNDTGLKYIFLDEADKLSQTAQGMLRNEMETYANDCRFILTCVAAGTRVYTPTGWKRVETVMPGDHVATGLGDPLSNRTTIVNHDNNLIELATAHGITLLATNHHRLWATHQWREARDLREGDRVTVSLKDQFGRDYPVVENDRPVISEQNFVDFLRKMRYIPRATRITAKAMGFFIAPCYLSRLESNLPHGNLTIRKLAHVLRTSMTVARQTMKRLTKTGLVAVARTNGTTIYSADWSAVLRHLVSGWHNLRNTLGLSQTQTYAEFHYDVFEATSRRPIEDIVENLSFVLTHEAELRSVMGRLAGFLCGDGHLAMKAMNFAAKTPDVLEKVAADLLLLRPGQNYRIQQNRPSGNRGHCIQVSDACLSLMFRFLGAPVGNKVNQAYRLPAPCYSSTQFGRAFVQALFDCDGTTPFMAHKDRTIAPIVLRQNTKDHQCSFHKDLMIYMKTRFDVHASHTISKPFSVRPTAINPRKPKDTEERISSTVAICQQTAICRYFEQIGSHYEAKKIRPDLLGYLRYKFGTISRDFMSLAQWKDAYDYHDGLMEDKIVLCKQHPGAVEVYDCSLDYLHSYVTNGLISHNCNFPRQIIPPLHSRLQEIRFTSLNKEEFALRTADVLALEGVACEAETLMDYVNATYPDLRKCLGMMQQNSRGDTLAPMTDSADGITDHVHNFIKLFRAGHYTDGRKLLIQQANPEEYPDIFRILYQNLDLFGAAESQQTKALLAIRDAARDNGVVADQEINMAACLAELAMIASDE